MARYFCQNLSGLIGNNVTARKADHLFQTPEVLEISDFKFTVVATPGHSPGGVSFIFEGDEFVIAACLVCWKCWPADLPGSAPDKLLTGIR